MRLTKIISGGQTGVDRRALDAALAHGFPCGGWCPPGRLAEDGPIPGYYPLLELDHGSYRQRTIRNVLDSDATVVIYFGHLEGGTEQTVLHCIRRQKPYKLIDAEEVLAARAADLIIAFVTSHAVSTLNVAGPRLSKAPRAHDYAFEVVDRVLQSASKSCAQQQFSADVPASAAPQQGRG